MWLWFAISDFFEAHKRSLMNSSPNGREDAQKGLSFIVLLIIAAYAVYYVSVYRCYFMTEEWNMCTTYTVKQIEEAKQAGKTLPTRYDDR